MPSLKECTVLVLWRIQRLAGCISTLLGLVEEIMSLNKLSLRRLSSIMVESTAMCQIGLDLTPGLPLSDCMTSDKLLNFSKTVQCSVKVGITTLPCL